MSAINRPQTLWSSLPAPKLIVHENKADSIHVSHINVRESVAFLLVKLVLIEVIMLFFSLVLVNILPNLTLLHNITLILLTLVKEGLLLFVILQWLNEYYEITPNKLIHKRGIFFKKKEEFTFVHLMSIDLHQTFWGRLLNYGDIHLFDRYIEQEVQMYFIHNPRRYFEILRGLIPYTDSSSQTVRDSFIEEGDDDEFDDDED
jgi:hypothetical protein